jgi:catechol 2,3-dioxygenase-like lactoylglutathione lyase family enzyme
VELLGLRTVIYPVNDLDSARAWWTGFLGIDPYFVEPYYVGFEVAGYELGLLPDANPEEGAHVYWGVSDVAATVADAITCGATMHTEPQDVGGGIVTALVTNPDDEIVGFIFNPNFKG